MRNIDYQVIGGEQVEETGWGEVWLYNVLQHTRRPGQVIENALRSACTLRIFEWIDIPAHEGHPHMLTQEQLDAWIGAEGSTVQLDENGCVGRAYHGTFHVRIDYDRIVREERPFADRLALWIDERLHPGTVVDVGCGPGIHVHALRDRGIEAYGYDLDERVEGRDHLTRLSLFDVHHPGDLVLCLEVGEHLEPALADDVVASVARNVSPGGLLIWTAAVPGQGGVGHLNCRPREYWEEKLIARGLSRDLAVENDMLDHVRQGYHMGWFVNNVMVFRRSASGS